VIIRHFCTDEFYSFSAVENILIVIRRGDLSIGINVESPEQRYKEERYVVKQNITIPIINKELECEIISNLVFTENSMVPILVNVTISTLVRRSLQIYLFVVACLFSKFSWPGGSEVTFRLSSETSTYYYSCLITQK